MWKIRKFSLQSGLELITTRLIDVVLTNATTEAGLFLSFSLEEFLEVDLEAYNIRTIRLNTWC